MKKTLFIVLFAACHFSCDQWIALPSDVEFDIDHAILFNYDDKLYSCPHAAYIRDIEVCITGWEGDQISIDQLARKISLEIYDQTLITQYVSAPSPEDTKKDVLMKSGRQVLIGYCEVFMKRYPNSRISFKGYCVGETSDNYDCYDTLLSCSVPKGVNLEDEG